MKKWLILIAFLLLFVPVTAQEIDPEADPTFGEQNVPANFSPDPIIITAVAGGSIDASAVSDECNGNIASAPDARITWTQGEIEMTGLRIFFISEADTTLVIQTPSGEFLCNDDNSIEGADPLSPVIDIAKVEDGIYNIWVGTLGEENAPGYIMLTELAETYPGQIANSFLGVIIEP